ncbi:MAG: ABC transporter substrate-binding protein [Lachnospiraceae bacterium]|nr:ABC transporter substrate-binding protein [Lachnospiraceae bacterium]
MVMAGCQSRSVAAETAAVGSTEANIAETENPTTENAEWKETESAETVRTVTFTDDLGREVTVQNPKRVAALLGSYADVWCLAGGSVCASADDAWDDFELDMPDDAVNLGMTKEISLEKLFAAEPDFIIASTNTQANMDMLDSLEAAQIPTAYFDVSDFEDYLRMLKICTDITGRADLYETNGLQVQAQIENVILDSKARLENQKAPKVLFLRASAASIRAKNSEGSVLGEMLHTLGCINIADSEESLLENLNIEYILKEDPDYIFTVQVGDDADGVKAGLEELFSQNSAWSGLTAVKEGHVYHMDKRLYNLKPNDRWGEAYEELERIFSDEKEQ